MQKHKWVSLIIIHPQAHKPLGLDVSQKEQRNICKNKHSFGERKTDVGSELGCGYKKRTFAKTIRIP